ncbi:MAG: hypothetical protein ACK4SZ_03065 [Allosphingosinicella sp.]|uniref:hypothetical protein n=1 Tax=Allosphingosinicella sp. TaxID=2823234 RepID=UPI00392E6493
MTALLESFARRLTVSAEAIGWTAAAAPQLVEARFRGQSQAGDHGLPTEKLGLQLGAYPLILTRLSLDADRDLAPQVRAMHAQVLIARSYLSPVQMVDLHLFLVADVPEADPALRARIDRLERDETICRKLVWVVGEDPNKSFGNFVDRTFLARPWRSPKAVRRTDFQLDKPADLVVDALVKCGLAPAVAADWVRLADDYIKEGRPDAAQFIDRLVASAGTFDG